MPALLDLSLHCTAVPNNKLLSSGRTLGAPSSEIAKVCHFYFERSPLDGMDPLKLISAHSAMLVSLDVSLKAKLFRELFHVPSAAIVSCGKRKVDVAFSDGRRNAKPAADPKMRYD